LQQGGNNNKNVAECIKESVENNPSLARDQGKIKIFPQGKLLLNEKFKKAKKYNGCNKYKLDFWGL
jgi:hypothetical protein